MSTLRINNIEAKSVPASPTIDEKVKITNSSGDVLVHIDGKTSGITTIGINTTSGNIKFDANSNIVVTGIITATKFVGTIEPTDLTVSGKVSVGGSVTAATFYGSGANLTNINSTGATGDFSIADKIVHTGDTNTAIRFPSNDNISFEVGGTERLRIDDVDGVVAKHATAANLRVQNSTAATSQVAQLDLAPANGLSGVQLKATSEEDFSTGANRTAFFTVDVRKDGTFSERLRITSSGMMSVGKTSNAGKAIEIYQASFAALRIQNSATGTANNDGILLEASGSDCLLYNYESANLKLGTAGTARLTITSGGHVSIGHDGDVATSNGGIGRKFGLRSTANNFIVGETTQSTAHYGIYIEARQTGRSGGARIAQFGLRNDDSGNGVISFQTAPSGADVTERVIIDSAGHLRPVANATYDLGVSGAAWRNLYVNDAHFSNEGGSNSVDGTWGSWTLQEGESDIFMINNRTGKKYAITMKEVN